jgi:glycosyltransferase involved in cell wall biosynthesis
MTHPIALCITDLDIGGAELCLVELATRLDRGQFEPVVYCLGPEPADPQASCVPRLREAGVEVHCLGARGYRHILGVLGQLRRFLRRQRPELVQTFLFHANLLGRLAAWGMGVPVACGIRVAERRKRWHLWADRATSRLVERYVSVSEAVARFSTTEGRLPPEKMAVIPNGVEIARYPAAPHDLTRLGLPPGRRAVTFIGRFDPQKGLRWLLETAPLWLDRLPDHHLLLVGKGPEQPALEAMCRRLSLHERVHFAGWQPDVAGILAASDLLVLPSRWEGMPNVVLQAMATGIPVVATNVEGVRELLGQGANSQVIPFGDTAALAERIVATASSAAMAAELGRENRQRAAQEFSIDRMVNAYQDLWHAMIAAARR